MPWKFSAGLPLPDGRGNLRVAVSRYSRSEFAVSGFPLKRKPHPALHTRQYLKQKTSKDSIYTGTTLLSHSGISQHPTNDLKIVLRGQGPQKYMSLPRRQVGR